ncbi:MAG TPA: hypothetical protein VH143_21755 [Kofleriaceae bacterium]|jgi:hypothetical protein|nr:hypothetical protein [Kofleriaceae bacterium]
MTQTPCATAIRNLAAGKFADAALPACTLGDATAALGALAGARDATGSLGTEHVQVKWRAIESGIAGDRLRLWHDGANVVAVEIESPRPAGGWSALRATLGAPDAKLSYWDGVVESKDGQWVYATRGVAVFTALADTELARVVAFPPTTVATYQARLARATEAPREIEAP